MDHEEERNSFLFYFFLFTSLLFKDQRENHSVITLRGYTFSMGNNIDIVVVQRDTAHTNVLGESCALTVCFIILEILFMLCLFY
jgi:hypothetical protein